MVGLPRELRYAIRSLVKSPAVTLVSVLALTLGIGLSTTMFSIVYGGLLRGLPFEEAERIMHLEANDVSRNIESMEVPVHDFRDWKAQQRSFDDLAGFYTGTLNVSGTEKADRYDGGFVSANFIDVLRARPILGRGFRAGEDEPGAEPVAVIGYQMWQTRFGGDRAVIGKTIRANGVPTTIVGVMPDGFKFPFNNEIWVPLPVHASRLPRGEGQTLEVVGRLKRGVSIDEATVAMNAIAKRLALEYPKTNQGEGVVIKPFTEEYVGKEPAAMLWTMLGAVFFVLLIACANVANLLLGRAAHRSREVGIRTALGASRAAVMRQFLLEAFALAGVGAALGIPIAVVGVRMFNVAIAGSGAPSWIKIAVDLPALLFVVAVTLVATLASGLLPALQAVRVDINSILKDESRGASSFRIGRLSRGLVMVEIALSCGLLVGAGLMVKSVAQLRTIDFGFTTADLFTARVGLPEATYGDTAKQRQFFDALEGRLGALPGAETALSTALPGLGTGGPPFAIEGVAYAKPEDYPWTRSASVSPSFFRTLGVRIRQGRDILPQDRPGSLPVAVVNESFARRFFKTGSPIGRRIRLGRAESTAPWVTIVGVVPDLYPGGIDEEEQQAIYLPLGQNPARFVSILARTRGRPAELTGPVRSAVAAIDADIPIYFVKTLAERIADNTWFYRVFGTLFMIFGFVALFLAAIGLYAVMSFSVKQRTREVGIRMALGAKAYDVARLMLRQGTVQIAIGMVAGLGIAAAVSNGLALVLFKVQPRDPAVFGSVVIVLTVTALTASLVPALRATRVDPVVALRE